MSGAFLHYVGGAVFIEMFISSLSVFTGNSDYTPGKNPIILIIIIVTYLYALVKLSTTAKFGLLAMSAFITIPLMFSLGVFMVYLSGIVSGIVVPILVLFFTMLCIMDNKTNSFNFIKTIREINKSFGANSDIYDCPGDGSIVKIFKYIFGVILNNILIFVIAPIILYNIISSYTSESTKFVSEGIKNTHTIFGIILLLLLSLTNDQVLKIISGLINSARSASPLEK